MMINIPQPIIVSVDWPSSPQEVGSQVGFNFTIMDTGTGGVIQMWLTNGGVEVLWEHPLEVVGGVQTEVWATFTMPAHPVQLYLEIGVCDPACIVTDNKSGPVISPPGIVPLPPSPIKIVLIVVGIIAAVVGIGAVIKKRKGS